jgi:curved DNA-binding protein CbpA
MTPVPEQGRLEELPLPRLLLMLHRERFSGALTLSRDRVGKRILFQQGLPVFAESNLASESLGVQLMDAGKLSRADYNRVVRHIDERRCKEGTALLALGVLEPKELFLALKDQLRTRIVECFGWPHGSFFVDPGQETAAEAQPFRTDLYALLQEGLETHWSSDRILQDLSPRMEEYPSRSKAFDQVAERLRRDPAVEALLEAFDGSRTLWRAVQVAHTPRALAAAWVLDAADALAYHDAPGRADVAAVPEREVEIVVAASADPQGRRARNAPDAREPRELDPRAAALMREIRERHEALDSLDHYQLLGVARDAPQDAVRRAYLQAAKTYHPDALARAGLDAQMRELANRVFAAISRAHAVLSDPKRRRDYDAVQGTRDTDLDANRLAQAETNYRKAEILVRQGNFRGALDYLRSAVDLWPEECAYQSALGWTLYKKAPSEPEAAREHLERAARLDPDDGVTQFRLSVVLRALGDESAAETAARRAQNLGS